MITRRFATRADAERFLVEAGYCFQGAPNRWRRPRPGGEGAVYAEILQRREGAVVILTEPSCVGASPAESREPPIFRTSAN